MTDVFQKKKRSQIMSLVRSSGNKTTELAMISIFKNNGITGWRRKYILFGNPDFIFRKERVALFVDGCFWHGCPTHGCLPASNISYWERKIQRNRQRDRSVDKHLKNEKWNVLRIWEHDLSLRKRPLLLRLFRNRGIILDSQ